MRKRSVWAAGNGCRLTTKRTRKNSSREEEGINALCLVKWSISGRIAWQDIDSREEIDLWLLQIFQPGRLTAIEMER